MRTATSASITPVQAGDEPWSRPATRTVARARSPCRVGRGANQEEAVQRTKKSGAQQDRRGTGVGEENLNGDGRMKCSSQKGAGATL